MSYITQIEKVIQEAIKEYNLKLSEVYGLVPCELEELWGSIMNSTAPKSKPKVKASPEKALVKPKPKASPEKPSPEETDGCPYAFTKGAKDGQKCGAKPKSCSTYCSRHSKYEGQELKVKKLTPQAKKSVAPPKKPRSPSSVKKQLNLVLRENKDIGSYWHPDTQMVFKSATQRIVIGKCVDGKVVDLTEEDKDVCRAHNFAFEDKIKEKVVDEELEEEVEPVKKVTKVPEKVKAKLNVDKAKNVKKSVMEAIAQSKSQAEDIEAILGELQIPAGGDFRGDDIDEDEIVEEEAEEEFEEEVDGEDEEEEFEEEEDGDE